MIAFGRTRVELYRRYTGAAQRRPKPAAALCGPGPPDPSGAAPPHPPSPRARNYLPTPRPAHPRAALAAALELAAAIEATGAPAPKSLAPARALFARALETPGGLKIQTLHAFCERLLHLFPFEANAPADFRVLDETEQSEWLAAARRQAMALYALGRARDSARTLEGALPLAVRPAKDASGAWPDDASEAAADHADIHADRPPRHVDGKELVIVRPGDFHRRRGHKQRGVVDQDVELAHLRHGPGESGVDGLLLRHVQRDGMGLGTKAFRRLLCRCKIDVGNRNFRPFGQIGAGKGQADAARRAGDQGGLVLQSHASASPFASKR